MAWIVARLAEALDYAYARGVLHGDIKPSNILLTADGVPMLLDFNLAVGWRSPVGDDLPGDAGGTLAYMAPERLRAIARPGPPGVGADAGATAARAEDRHRADLYALGMVLLEALAGRPPDRPRGVARGPRELASAFALSRQQGGEALIRSCRVAIAPGLRSILMRCLAPDPADRYRRGAELAEDLDRWCNDRALAFAPEPRGCWSGLVRWARRRRLALAAAVLSLAVAVASTLAAWGVNRTTLQEQALAKLARLWDGAESKAFRFRQFGRWRVEESDAPEDAFRHLVDYHVLGPGDWRDRDEFRALPESDREELEAWVLEQALRLGRALGQRPDAPDDWRRGLEALERVVALRPIGPLETQRRLLRRQLGLPEPPAAAPARGAGPSPRWLEEYLLGIEAEPLRATDALAHYRNVLRERPGSFWGHYRAATAAHRLGDSAAAAEHLKHCIARRPENPALRSQLAGCLYDLRRFDDALEQCDKALTLNPDHAESYRTRAFIRGRLGQAEGLKTDIDRFELLTRHLGKVPTWRLRLDWLLFQPADRAGAGAGAGAGGLTPDRGLAGGDLPRLLLTADPEDVDLRTALAQHLLEKGQQEAALAELDKVLEINPDHLRARYLRGGLLYRLGREEADGDLAYLLDHPRFEELLRQSSQAIHAFHYDAWALVKKGKLDKALQVAARGLDHAQRIGTMRGESHYVLARVNAVAARSDPARLQEAVTHLRSASQYHRKYLQQWYGKDPFFNGQREAIDARLRDLRRVPD